MNNKIYSMLGLCMKAGKLACGFDVCVENIKKKNAFLIIIAEDASPNTKEKIIYIANEYGVEVLEYGNKFDLSTAIGKREKVVVAILDNGFGSKITQLVKESKGDIN